jgi:F0F1-type ATP synthase assembly protein I
MASPWKDVSRYLALGMMFPASTVAGLLIGHGLDRLFGTQFLFWVFMLLGIAAAFVEFVRVTSRM